VNLIIESLKIQNFLSISQIELNFTNNGLYLIQGIVEDSTSSDSNGVGKSSIIDSLCWVLFDKTLRGISKDNVVNRFMKKNCVVELRGKLNGQNICIIRHRNHEIEKNSVILIYNENNITQRSDSETNEKIQEILEMSFDDFQTNIVFSNNSLKFLELGDTERKKLFDSIVKSDLYEKCIDIVKQKIKIKNEIIDELNIEKIRLQDKINFNNEELKESLKNSENWKENNESCLNQYKKEKEIYNKQIEEEKQKTCDIKESKDYLLQSNENLEKQIKEIDIEMKKNQENNEIQEIRLKIDNFQNDKEVEEIRLKIKENSDEFNNFKIECTKISSKINELKTKIEFINEQRKLLNEEKQKLVKSLDENICPTCHQKLQTTDEIKNKINNINDKLINLTNNENEEVLKKLEDESNLKLEKAKIIKSNLDLNNNLLEEKQKNINEQIEKLKDEEKKIKENLNKQFSDLLNLKNNKNTTINQNIEKINKIKNFELNKKNCLDKIQIKINECDKNIEKLQNDENLFLIKIDKIKKDLDQLNLNENNMSSKILKEVLELENIKYWLKGFKEIKGLLISTITPIMNKKAEEYSNILTSGEFVLNFITQRENKDGSLKDVFDIEVFRQNGGNNYKNLSSGEKRRVDLITIFVLDELKRLNNIHNINIRFYDEIFDSLDEVGIQKMIDLLEIFSEDRQLFVISHKQDLKDLFKNVVTIIKRKGMSNLL